MRRVWAMFLPGAQHDCALPLQALLQIGESREAEIEGLHGS